MGAPFVGTAFDGPLISGDQRFRVGSTPANIGVADLVQQCTLTAGTVSALLSVPQQSMLLNFFVDTLIAFNSQTSAVVSVGATNGATTYVQSATVATTGRVIPTFTTAQLSAMLNVNSTTNVFATVTQVGTAATTGLAVVTMFYGQTTRG